MTPAAHHDQLPPHVVVCGLGHVGYRVVRLLIQLGCQGVVVTRQVVEDWRRAIEPQFSVIVGDAQGDRLLEQAGAARAKAVIIVTDDDLANLSIALDARRINPQAALIVRQFDQELAVHLEQSVAIDRALSASALAAPPFAAAALGISVRCSFAAGDVVCRVEDESVDAGLAAASTSLATWAAGGGKAAIALRRDGQTMLACSPDTPLRPGDHVIALRATENQPVPRAARGSLGRRRAAMSLPRKFAVGCRQWWREVPGAMRAAMAVLSLVLLTSVFVFRVAMGLPLVDALYFAVTTITTVGYGDYNLKDAGPALKLFGVLLMFCGAALLAVIFSIATDLILRTRFRDLMAPSAEQSRDHVIVAGLGNIGYRLVCDLVQAGQAVVAIEQRADAPFVEAARELAPVVLGNAKTAETLRKAGAAGAKAVVAVTDNDLTNLSAALAAKRIQPGCRIVLRVFNSELAEKVQRGLALESVLSVAAAAAPTFVAAALYPQTLHGFVLDDWLLTVFHRVAGTADDDSPPAAADQNQAVLLVRPAGANRYEAAAAGRAPRPGDEILGVRWFRLAEKRGER